LEEVRAETPFAERQTESFGISPAGNSGGETAKSLLKRKAVPPALRAGNFKKQITSYKQISNSKSQIV